MWDVVKGEALWNFRGHSSRVMCVVWSYLDPDLVYSGGEDGTVRPWKPSLQQHRQPPVSGGSLVFSKPFLIKKIHQVITKEIITVMVVWIPGFYAFISLFTP